VYLFAHLDKLGGTNFTSLNEYCCATAIRTANKTIRGWQRHVDTLRLTAEQHLSIALVASGALNGPWWDTMPCALHLECAYRGTGHFQAFSFASLEAKKAQKEPENKKGVQAIAFKCINQISFDSEARFLLLSRRTSPLGLSCRYTLTRTDVEKAFDCAHRSAYHDALAWLKTVTNAWCTSTRMHEPVHLKCIFGCKDAKDCISHYLECLILWSIINEAFQGFVHPLPTGKLNYLEPSSNSVIVISAAFEVYHALKIGLRETVEAALACRRFDEVHRVSHKLIHEKSEASYGRLILPQPLQSVQARHTDKSKVKKCRGLETPQAPS
jgi:hypothetical protein